MQYQKAPIDRRNKRDYSSVGSFDVVAKVTASTKDGRNKKKDQNYR